MSPPITWTPLAAQAVAEYLRKKQGFLLVSHDRAFLDGCVDHILALNKTGVSVQSGTFSTWWENKSRQDAYEQAQNDKLKGEMKRLAQAAKRTSTWSDRVEATKTGSRNSGLRPDRGYIGHRSAKMMQRAKSIDTRRQKALEEASGLLRDLERADSLKLRPLTARGRLLDLREVVPHYGGRPVCPPPDLCSGAGRPCGPDRRQRLRKEHSAEAVDGPGDFLGRHVHATPGSLHLLCSQDTSNLRGSLHDFVRERNADETLLLAILRKLDFPRVQFEKDMANWSAGQKKKALIAAASAKVPTCTFGMNR